MLTEYEVKAQALGVAQAEAEIESGAQYPTDSPLSGEWADSLTPRDLATRVGYLDEVAGYVPEEGVSGLCDAFEAGYSGTWQYELDDRLQASGGECEWL
jgi:hypothetical protein